MADPPKSVELEVRIGRLEVALAGVLEENETLKRRMAALQAQLDYVAAKLSERLVRNSL